MLRRRIEHRGARGLHAFMLAMAVLNRRDLHLLAD
jgi:hypothetical protein